MFEHSALPESFQALRLARPEAFTLSERVLEPIILIDKVAGKIVAQLGASRHQDGVLRFLLAPSNRHAWVTDGLTIRPIPRDAPQLFHQVLAQCDPSNLRYSEAIRLIRDSGEQLSVHTTERLRAAGKISADSLASTLDVPGLCGTLFPYQARGVKWMHETLKNSGGLILADEMGLGKTIQIIALLLLGPPEKHSPALIVCPTSLIANWERELQRFAPGLTVQIHRGPHRTGVYRGLQTATVIIATYETVTNDIAIFSSFEWSWLICDEAQALKNPSSNRRRAIAREMLNN